MLSNYLQKAIKDINALIELTQQDIHDIKQAKHDNVFEHTKLKNNLIVSFEANKALLDNELVLRVKANKTETLAEILSTQESVLLQEMKESLASLRKLNKQYAKFVVSVGEFYNSLMDNMFPIDEQGYQKPVPKPASFLKVRV